MGSDRRRPSMATVRRRVDRSGAMSALVALSVLLTVELLRAFPALVAFQVDPRGRLPLPFQATVLVVPFLGAALTMLVTIRLDPRRVLLVCGLLLGCGRIGAQLVHGDLGAVIAGAGLLGGLAAIALLAMLGLPLFGGGVIAGVGMAAALRVALGSRDLIWIDHPAAVVAVVAVVGWFALILVVRTRRAVEVLGRRPRTAVPLVAIGPVLLLEAYVLTNLGWVSPAIDRGWLGASFVIAASTAAGVAVAAYTAWAPAGPVRSTGLVGAVAVVALAVSHSAPGLGWAVPLLLAQAGIANLLTAGSARGVRTGGRWAPALAVGIGLLLLLASIVALDGRGLLGVVVRPSAAVGVGGLVLLVAAIAVRSLPPPPAHRAGLRHVPSLAGIFVLPAVLLLAGLPLLARAGGAGAVVDARELRVVSYNVQLGFTADGRLNLDEVAAVLDDARPDIVALQEVPRGFLPTGGVDMLGWLQQSLGFDYVAFQPSSPGALHGNAVLSRYPIDDVEVRRFGRSGTALPRGALAAVIDVPYGDDVVVISTHFPPGGSGADSRERTGAVLALWGGRERAIVGIDANAGPSSAALQRLTDAGLQIADSDADTYPAVRPRSRIDFVLHTPELVTTSVDVPSTRASDHLPVVAVLRPADLVG
ncbi:MAG: endonuclease/exonuclease/phosphatase family protein [Acidimicrobiia bacterium]|nr:endonuclease/exonuclease/phosphatase family protein [Acidimicrobiia bacterium]